VLNEKQSKELDKILTSMYDREHLQDIAGSLPDWLELSAKIGQMMGASIHALEISIACNRILSKPEKKARKRRKEPTPAPMVM
jgi:hypothetical protein